MQEIRVPLEPTFRFDFALRYLQRSPDEIIDLVDGSSHFRVLTNSGQTALIEMGLRETEDGSEIHARSLTGEVCPDDIRSAVERIYLPHKTGARDSIDEPLAQELRENFQGLPVVQTLTPWEALVWAVIGQQINIAFAYRLKRAFVEQFGDSVPYGGRTYYAFPSPERVAELDHERDLRPIQFSRQKSRYVIAAAQSVLDGTLDFDQIERLDDDGASMALQAQLGIGRWTAEYILLRGFGRLDVIPAGDAALKALVGQYQQLGRAATELEVRVLAERWKPWRGETAFMLWFAKQAGFFKE